MGGQMGKMESLKFCFLERSDFLADSCLFRFHCVYTFTPSHITQVRYDIEHWYLEVSKQFVVDHFWSPMSCKNIYEYAPSCDASQIH